MKQGAVEMTAYQILGVPEKCSVEELKRAFRAKVKHLHPDLLDEEDKASAHVAMICVIDAYEKLLILAKQTADDSATRGATRTAEDRAYQCYKKGIELMRAVHPSKWKHVSLYSLFTPGAEEREDEESAKIIAELVTNLSEAAYYFSTVIRQFPQSCWREDSLVKMRQIGKMKTLYPKIIESYRRGG